MRITTSDNYFHGYACPLRDCQRQYCPEDRLLYRDCDTALPSDDGIRTLWYSENECPACLTRARLRRTAMQQEKLGVTR